MITISIADINKKNQHEHAYKLLRECLAPLSVDFNENYPICENKNGKPFLADNPNLKFNISHSDGIAACVVSHRECGIDCEKVGEYHPKAAKRIFSENEIKMIESAPEDERGLLFFRVWTLKEAYAKALGVGISFPLNTVEFIIKDGKVKTNIKEYRFKQCVLKNGDYVVSLCEKRKKKEIA